MKLFPLADRPTPEDYQCLGLPAGSRNVRAVLTGEYRSPLKGEWYISGAINEAYRANGNLFTSYNIARLVATED